MNQGTLYLSENKRNFVYHALVLQGEELAGWSWGHQDSPGSFRILNSMILPPHRRRGLYSRILQHMVDKYVDMGINQIWSQVGAINQPMIIAKLKKDFMITGVETAGDPGILLHLSYKKTTPSENPSGVGRMGRLTTGQ